MRVLSTLPLGIALIAAAPRDAAAQQTDRTIDDVHRGLQIATMSSLLVTGTLGTIAAMNKPTLFGEGRCASGDPVLGEYGCKGLSVLHGLSAIVSLVLYTATTTIEVVEYDWPGRGQHGAGFEAASWVHLIGMGALPIAGIITVVPDVLGIGQDDRAAFQRVLRTIHLGFAYATVGSYVATAAIDLD
jgi:hypothetical protein